MDRQRSLLYGALLLTIVLFVLHELANTFSFYWLYWWYDYMMHFLAGLAGGLAAYWVLLHSGLWRRKTDAILLPILSVFISLMVVGVAWEIFEYVNDITDAHENTYATDVVHDLILDALGAILAVIIGLKQTLLRKGPTFNG